MWHPYVLALVAVALFGGTDFLYKKAHEQKMDEASYLCVQSGVVVFTLMLLSVGWLGWSMTARGAALGVGCGVLAFGTAIAVLYAVGRGPVTTTTAIRRLSFLVTGALAIAFLGERITIGKVVGIALAVIGVLLMAAATGERQKPHFATYIALVLSGLLAFGHKLAAVLGVSASAFLVLQATTVHVCSHVLVRMLGGYKITRPTRVIAPITGATVAIGMVLAVLALRTGEALVIVPLLQLSFLVTAPLGFAFVKEPVTARKVAGILVGASCVLSFGLLT